MKRFKKLIAFVLAITLVLSTGQAHVFAATAGSINTWRIYVNKGKTVTIPHSGKISFSSSNKKVATVTSKGVVKGIASDNTYIKASYYPTSKSKKTTYNLSVMVITSKIPATAVTVSKKSISMSVGDKQMLNYKTKPANTTDEIMYFSDNPDVVSTSNSSYLEAVGQGKAKVTIVSSSGKKATVTVTVKANKKNYTTQFGVQVPILKKSLKKGNLEILAYDLDGYKDSKGQLSIYGYVTIKNNSSAAIDSNSRLGVKFYNSSKKEIKVEEWDSKIHINNYIPSKAKMKKADEVSTARFDIPKNTKTFTVGAAEINPASDWKVLKASKSVGGVKFPSFPQTITHPRNSNMKLEINQITNGSNGTYIYIKNIGTEAVYTPYIDPISYNSKNELIGYGYIGSVHLAPGETFKESFYYTWGAKAVDFVYRENDFRSGDYYTAIQGTVDTNGIKLPAIGTVFTVNGYKVEVTNHKLKKDERNSNTSWYYRTDLIEKYKVNEAGENSSYRSIYFNYKFYEGSYVIDDYGYVSQDNPQVNAEFSSNEIFMYSKFLKKDKAETQCDRIDLLINK